MDHVFTFVVLVSNLILLHQIVYPLLNAIDNRNTLLLSFFLQSRITTTLSTTFPHSYPQINRLCTGNPCVYDWMLKLLSLRLHSPFIRPTMLLELLTTSHLLVTQGLACPPYPFSNITLNNAGTAAATAGPTAGPTALTIPTAAPASLCQTAYPADIRQMNSLFPTYEFPPTTWFNVLRQTNDVFQVATQIQFQGLPNNSSTCQLELELPHLDMTTVLGPSPLITVYQVKREAGAPASWDLYEGDTGNNTNKATDVFGKVNGDPKALSATRENGGLTVVGTALCNETLTFQMGKFFRKEISSYEFR